MSTLKAVLDKIQAKSDELGKVFDEAGAELDLSLVKSIEGDDNQTTADKVAWIQDREKELAELQSEAATLVEIEKSRENHGQLKSILDLLSMPANQIAGAVEAAKGGTKSFGEQFAERWRPELKGQEIEFGDIEIKTLFETAAGWLPESTRTGKLVDFATRPVQITDIIPFTTTGQAAVVYMEETTFTNAAAGVAEGGTYAESAFELTERTSPVRKIGHYIPVTDEQLEDVQQAQGYLDNRMRFGLLQTLDSDLLVGDGVGPNLEGISIRAGVQTQAKATDPVPDAIHKAMTKVKVTGRALPSAIAMHSTDWQIVRLLRTADGIYIYGNPNEAGNPVMWGLPVVSNEVLSAGTALVGDFRNFSEFAVRRGVTVKVSDSHSDFFINGKQAIRADMRGALQVYRPAAFCTVTGIV